MKTKYTINELCKKYTSLSNNDISKIIDISKSLDFMADFENSDVFIDVLSKSRNVAIVVAEAKPKKSVYHDSVIGKKALRSNEPGVLKALEKGLPSKDIRALTQEYKFVKQKIHPIKNDNKVIAVLIVEKDISNEIKEDFKIGLNKSIETNTESQKLMNLINSNQIVNNNLDDAILIFDNEGKLKIKNNKASILYKMLDKKNDIEETHYDKVSLDNKKFDNLNKQIRYCNGKKVLKREVKVGDFYFKVKTVLTNEEDLSVVEIIKDITEIKNKEAEIISKSVAIREIHHRVKNNLQTVASLLRIQSRRCKSEEAKVTLEESVNRILAIAATHELLSKEIKDEVNIMDVINAVANNAKRYFNNISQRIDIEVNGEDFYLDTDRITSISLIINELIQNCFDHAFRNLKSGKIQISISGDDENKIISVEDNGEGFDTSKESNSSLGLSIVKSYIKDKLRGDINIISNTTGTKVQFKFPIKI